jgi:phage minor structural protein
VICVYAPDCTDFSNNGLGPVSPQSASVTETLNGEYELTLVHPLDEAGKWQRLVEGCILRAPVPAGATPQVDLVKQPATGTMIYKVSTNRDPLRLRSGTGTKYKILAKYKKGTEVIVLAKTTSSWFEVSCPDGKHGYMASQYLTHVRTIINPAVATGEVIESRQLRDQPFRIYRVVPELDKITVYARHVFYDLLDNMIKSYKPSSSTMGASVVQGISGGCQTEHDFTFYSNLDATAEEVEFVNINPVEALLGEGGVVEKYAGELQRDWFDVFLVTRIGHDKDVQIRQGKNLLGISYDVDLTNVTTRIMPTGEDKNGELLYLPELYIDSPYLESYVQPKWMHLAVSDAKEVTKGDDKKTKAQCYSEMRNAVQAEFDAGCDLPTVTLKVDFINCAETVEYAQYKALQNIYLGDSVRVIARRIGVEVSMRMTQYTYDCLTRKYTAVTLGTVADTIEGNMISARQLASGIISGSKLAINSVGSGQLQSGSVGALQIQLAAIQSAHIETAAIISAHIANAAIQTAHIGDAQITNAQIADATITAAKIAQATITAACIAKATITEAEIADAAITSAKIALATITDAHIVEAAITTAHIADLAVTAAKIANATITSAKIAHAAIQSAHIEDAAITKAKIALLAVDEARIADLAIGTAKVQNASITNAKIADLAVTAAKIANATITNAQIANATIDTAQIALGAITTALIAQGAVGTAQIADASITDAKIVELSANRITTGTLSVERLIIVGSDKSIVYTINEANGTAQLSQTTIDGGSLTQRSITADRIVAGAITANEIAAAAILANNIAAGAITAEKIAAGAVEASHIKAGTITSSHLAAEVGESLNLSSNKSINSKVETIYADMDNLIGYRIEIISTSDILSSAIRQTVLSARVWHGSEDVTDTIPAERFAWSRISSDETADRLWNAAHTGVKSIQLTVLDVQYSATYQCDLLGA